MGHSVTVLQAGNILIGFPKPEGISAGQIIRFLSQCYRFIFKRKNFPLCYEQDDVKYQYYNSLYFSSYKRFKIWFNQNSFDFIHAHFLWCCNALPKIKEKCGIPFVVTAHGSDIHTNPFASKKARKSALHILNSADGVFFVSEFLHKKAVELGWSGTDFLVTGNGYFSDFFYQTGKKAIDKDNVLLGFIGNPIAVKRFEILPDVLYEVRKVFPTTQLLCVGSTSQDTDLRNSARQRLEQLNLLDAVTFVDKVPYRQVPEYMRKIDILLLPSRNEGFSCVALEAQACGTPVISSANGGIPEATGNIGLCVPESDRFTQDFAEKIIEYIKNPYPMERIVAASSGRTWDAVVGKEIEAIASFIDNQ